MVFLNVMLLIAGIGILYFLNKRKLSFTQRVFIAMGLGIILGGTLQWIYGAESPIIDDTAQWFNLVGGGYVRLLKMIVMPLIMVSIISALVNVEKMDTVFRQGIMIIGILMATTGIAAAIGITVANGFDLSAESLLNDSVILSGSVEDKMELVEEQSFPERILQMIPENPFLDLTGARPTSTIGVVIFATFIGVAALRALPYREKEIRLFIDLINGLQGIILEVVDIILSLTPYGVFALLANTIARTDIRGIASLAEFVVASYVAMAIVFMIHLALLTLVKVNPILYVKKALAPLSFAFSSRSSAGTMPLNIETQTQKMGVAKEIANLSASFGATIGQNGCGGVYPAMLAVMVAPTVGINPLEWDFMLSLIMVIIISSFGVAGVGGGATFAALIVLSTLNLPVAIVGLLISVDPLIDMGRTALNVNGSMAAGVLTAKLSGKLDEEIMRTE